MRQINKKGQLGGLFGAITIIAAIALLITIMLYVMSQVGENTKVTGVSNTVDVEVGWINSTTYSLQNKDKLDFALVSLLAKNATSGAVIGSGNYTISDGVITNATSIRWNFVNFTYTYTQSTATASYNATISVQDQFVDFLPWIAIILIALASGAVLFFVIRSFGQRQGV